MEISVEEFLYKSMSRSSHVLNKCLGPLVWHSGEPENKGTISGRSSGNILA